MVKTDFATRLRCTLSIAATVLVVLGLLTPAGAGAAPVAEPEAEGTGLAASTNLVIQNVGQFASEARFMLRQGDYRIWLTDDSIWLVVPELARRDDVRRLEGAGSLAPLARQRHALAGTRSGTAIRFAFEGANGAPNLEPFGPIPTRVSYLIGSDPANWQTNVPAFAAVRYRDLYPGIDLVIGDVAGGLVPWRFEARPGADLSAVRLRADGAEAVSAEGAHLRLSIRGRTLDVALPAWSVAGAELTGGGAVAQPEQSAFALMPATESAATATTAQVNGPAAGDLIYNTQLAGAASDLGYAIAADGVGNTYITGETQSTNFPVSPGAVDPANEGVADLTEAFVAKYDANGSPTPVYLTYLGGSDLDIGWGIAVSGNLAFVAGETKSSDFPGTTGTASGTDIFVAALNADGTGIRYATRLGGTGFDAAFGLAVWALDAYLVGTTNSSSVCAGSSSGDLLVAKLGASGAVAYASCLPSADPDAGYGIAVRNGEAFVAGDTTSSVNFSRDITTGWFTTAGAPGGGRVFETSGNDWANGLAVDATGSFYVIGTTATSSGYPGTASTAPWGGGLTDALVMKLSKSGTSLTLDFATYLGGDGDDYGYGIAVDTVNALYVTGSTTSASFPMTTGALATAPFGGADAFVARMHLQSAALDRVTYATYLGAGFDDGAYGIATDTGGHAYVTGSTQTSADSDSNNAFVAKIKVSSPLAPPSPVSIRVSGSNALLTWDPVSGRSYYQVFGSSQPYFQPGDWSSVSPLASPTATSYTHVNVLSAVDAHFYVVKTVNSVPAASANSNRVGEFTFQLVKGTP